MTYVFLIFIFLHFILDAKIMQWTTYKFIGLSGEEPGIFLFNLHILFIVRIILLLGAVIALFLSSVTWYFGIFVLAAAWWGAGRLGQHMAFTKFREISFELVKEAKSEQERNMFLRNSQQTDDQLRSEAKSMSKVVKMFNL